MEVSAMGVLARIRRLVRANVYDAISQYENPVKMVNYLVLEMQEELEHAREEVASAMAREHRLAQQAAQAADRAALWENRARHAMAQGNETLALEAIRRKLAAENLAAYYEEAHRRQGADVAELRASLDRLAARLAEVEAKRSALIAQASVTQAEHALANSAKHIGGREAYTEFQRAAAMIDSAHAHAHARRDLAYDTVEDAFVAAEETQSVEQAFQAMKRELTYTPQPALMVEEDGADGDRSA